MPPRLLPLGLVSLVFNLGGGVIAPTLPLYARSLGADYRDLGLIGAAHGLAFAALTIPLGRASDRVGRRAILVVSALAVGAAAGCYLLSTNVAGLAAGKLVEAAGWAAFWPALEAWAAEEFGRRTGAAMGVGYGAYAAAFVIGSAVAGFLVEAAGLRVPFAVYAATSAVSVVLALTLAGGHAGGRHPAPPPEPGPAREGLARTGDARRRRLLAYGTGFVYVYGLGTVTAFLPAYATDRGLGPRAVGFLVAGYWVARFAGSLGAGAGSDRLGRRVVLLPALAVAGLSAGLIAMPGGAALMVLGTVGLGLAAGACAPTCIGLIADAVRPADRGIAMGLFEAACGVSILVSGLVGGALAQALGGQAPYVLVAALALGWMALLARRLPGDLPVA